MKFIDTYASFDGYLFTTESDIFFVRKEHVADIVFDQGSTFHSFLGHALNHANIAESEIILRSFGYCIVPRVQEFGQNRFVKVKDGYEISPCRHKL